MELFTLPELYEQVNMALHKGLDQSAVVNLVDDHFTLFKGTLVKGDIVVRVFTRKGDLIIECADDCDCLFEIHLQPSGAYSIV